MKISALLLLSFICFHCCAQQDSCYQNSWTKRIAKKLPANVCINKEETIYQFFSDFDFNKDGLSDIAIKAGKSKKSNGDTLKLTIFRQLIDSTFVEFMQLDNIFPIYFEKYSLDYNIQDEGLLKTKNRYQEAYPLEHLKLEDNYISIRMIADATASFHLLYTYSTPEKDWLLTEFSIVNEEIDTVINHDTFRLGTSILDFSYFDYIEGNF
jgi:hypothetical protein